MRKRALIALIVYVACLALYPSDTPARGSVLRPNPLRFHGPVTATWYGPGLYGNRFACAGKTAPDGTELPTRYWRGVRGVAHRYLPCGTRIMLRRWHPTEHRYRFALVRVIDRGPYSAATFDLTARTAMDLCACTRPYTMKTSWRKSWRWH